MAKPAQTFFLNFDASGTGFLCKLPISTSRLLLYNMEIFTADVLQRVIRELFVLCKITLAKLGQNVAFQSRYLMYSLRDSGHSMELKSRYISLHKTALCFVMLIFFILLLAIYLVKPICTLFSEF